MCSASGTLAVGLRRGDERLLRDGPPVRVRGARGGGRSRSRVMEWALISHDFSIEYVAENNARATPLLYTITGPVGRARGIDPAVGPDPRRLPRGDGLPVPRPARPIRWSRGRRSSASSSRSSSSRSCSARPTRSRPLADDAGRRAGPEPAAAEPPAHGVPPADALPRATSASRCRSAFAIAALVTGRFGEGWLADTRRATLVAWGFLIVGILLGAWWSYEVLGWGGYWAWDPVENASLLPWLTGDRVHPLGDRAGAARDAAGLEPVARHRDVLPHDPRHVPHPLGRR